MATVRTTYPGNLALQQEVWTLTLPEAKALLPALDIHPGSYWHQVVAKPTRRAIRAKATSVTVYTAGFSSGELSNVVYATGGHIQRTA